MNNVMNSTAFDPLTAAATAILSLAAATLVGVWFLEFWLDINPCALCLEQRYAHYFAASVAAVMILTTKLNASRIWLIPGFALIALVMLINASLGTYHAGVEWGWWPGLNGCSRPIVGLGGNWLETSKTAEVVRCEETQWRFLGLSLAEYNVLISLALACLALWSIGTCRWSTTPPLRA